MPQSLRSRGRRPNRPWLAGVLAAVLVAGAGTVCDATAQADAGHARPEQASFESAQAAVTALVQAAESGSTAAMARVLGPGSGRVLRSGDDAADAQARADFLTAYRQRSHVEGSEAGRATLYVGNNDWALPFPIVQSHARWRFDTRAGVQQYLNRQIGANELSALAVMNAYVQAQREYVLHDRDNDSVLEYAQRIVSSPGLHDGLYWPVAAGESLSPMGARFALANLGPYRGTDDAPQPYDGYYFRQLTAQGPDAPGGAYDYRVNGKQIGGYALLAWPARYGVSGVMTFIVNHDGVTYSKNLGRATSAQAQAITAFNPDATWKRETAP